MHRKSSRRKTTAFILVVFFTVHESHLKSFVLFPLEEKKMSLWLVQTKFATELLEISAEALPPFGSCKIYARIGEGKWFIFVYIGYVSGSRMSISEIIARFDLKFSHSYSRLVILDLWFSTPRRRAHHPEALGIAFWCVFPAAVGKRQEFRNVFTGRALKSVADKLHLHYGQISRLIIRWSSINFCVNCYKLRKRRVANIDFSF